MIDRTETTPRWVWVMLVLAILLLFITVVSKFLSGPRLAVSVGPEVITGNPQDYMRPGPMPTMTPTATPSPSQVPQPQPTVTPSQPATSGGSGPKTIAPPEGLPESIQFGGKTWSFAGGPLTVDVQTTGEYAGDY
jgi:hypothetical protein